MRLNRNEHLGTRNRGEAVFTFWTDSKSRNSLHSFSFTKRMNAHGTRFKAELNYLKDTFGNSLHTLLSLKFSPDRCVQSHYGFDTRLSVAHGFVSRCRTHCTKNKRSVSVFHMTKLLNFVFVRPAERRNVDYLLCNQFDPFIIIFRMNNLYEWHALNVSNSTGCDADDVTRNVGCIVHVFVVSPKWRYE